MLLWEEDYMRDARRELIMKISVGSAMVIYIINTIVELVFGEKVKLVFKDISLILAFFLFTVVIIYSIIKKQYTLTIIVLGLIIPTMICVVGVIIKKPFLKFIGAGCTIISMIIMLICKSIYIKYKLKK